MYIIFLNIQLKMSISHQNYINTQSNHIMDSYKNITYSILVDLFGDYFTYNELAKFNSDKIYFLDIGTKLFENHEGIMTIWIDKNYVKDIEFKNTGFELAYKLNELNYKKKEKKFYYKSRTIDLAFYNEYIEKRICKQSKKIINEMWKDLDDDEKLIDIKTIYFRESNDLTYTELILLDTDLGYIPVIIENINTSSPYCLEKSNYDYDCNYDTDDEYNDEINNNMITLDYITSNLLEIF